MPTRHVKKNDKKRKDAYPKRYATCPQGMSKKKKKGEEEEENIAHTKKKDRRERNHAKEFLHHPLKISTHLPILIQVYDLFGCCNRDEDMFMITHFSLLVSLYQCTDIIMMQRQWNNDTYHSYTYS